MSDTTATSDDVASGKTFFSQGEKQTGIIYERKAGSSYEISFTPDTLMESYESYDPNGGSSTYLAFRPTKDVLMRLGSKFGVPEKLIGNSISASSILKGKTVYGTQGTATSDANATANDMANGKTAYVNGTKVTGSLKEIGNDIVDHTAMTYVGDDGTEIILRCNSDTIARNRSGKYITRTALADGLGLTSSILKKGATICGVTGTLEEGDQIIAHAKSVYNYLKTNCSAVAIIPILVKSGTTLVHHQFQNKIKTLSSGYSLTTSGCSFRTISNAAYVDDAGSTTRDMTGIVPNTVGQVLKNDTLTGEVCVVRELSGSYLAGVNVSIPARSGVNGCCVAGVFATIKGSVSGSSFTSSRPYNIIIVSM